MSPTAWTMLTAAVAGDILTIAGGFAAERYRHYREASATKAALSVEARAAIEWFKSNDLIKNIQLILAGIVMISLGGCERDPRDESMIANFQKHREKFELLRQMVVHDKEDTGNKIENSVPI